MSEAKKIGQLNESLREIFEDVPRWNARQTDDENRHFAMTVYKVLKDFPLITTAGDSFLGSVLEFPAVWDAQLNFQDSLDDRDHKERERWAHLSQKYLGSPHWGKIVREFAPFYGQDADPLDKRIRSRAKALAKKMQMTDVIAIVAGRNPGDIYFDDVSLVVYDQTVVGDARGKSIQQLTAALAGSSGNYDPDRWDR